MKEQLNRLDPVSRREFALRTAKTALGVSLLPVGSRLATTARAESSAPGFGKAKHVIFLWMGGGMTHIDTFDPKMGSTKGPGTPVKAKAGSGNIDYLGQYLPKLAEMANKFSLVRSMSSKTGVHEAGTYIMKTGYEPRTTIVHPSMGAWASHFLGRIKGVTLPDSVTIGGSNSSAGFFPPALSPVPISSAEAGLQNIRPTASEDMFSKRVGLMNEFDAAFREKYKSEDVKAYTEFYEETLKLLKSEDLKAFDISQEPANVKEKYGRGFGSGCLLARRLVEHGVRFVEVNLGGWDMHNQLDTSMTNNGNTLDTGLSALLTDLEAKGLLEDTLVCLGSEFGRTPDINENDGRDHYPLAYTTFFAGAGIKGGYAHGATDKDGRRVADKQATPQDFLCTIGHAMGLPVEEVVMSPSGRPFTVGDKGSPILELFA